ncbi:hypothetical protein LCGC14_1621740 [marine sediment metagenome]|uniref:DUF551 domain-containing protein n=1 Tax=marine sediment metagenome TaxID=412755 RepID=A0A0F9KKU0_9ZZZZ
MKKKQIITGRQQKETIKQSQAKLNDLKIESAKDKGDIVGLIGSQKIHLATIKKLQAELAELQWRDMVKPPKARVDVLTISPKEPSFDKPKPAVAYMTEDGKWYTAGNKSGMYKPVCWMSIPKRKLEQETIDVEDK